MKKILPVLAALMAFAMAPTPSHAALTVVLDCSVVGLNDINPNAQQCVGYYDGNQLTTSTGGNASTDEVNALALLGLTAPPTITALQKLDLNGATNTVNFDAPLNGITYIGIHYGGGGDVPQSNGSGLTAFYRFDAGTNLDSITTQFSNLSGATLYKTGVGGVPEPATWAFMLIGFAMMGSALRRRSVKTTLSYA